MISWHLSTLSVLPRAWHSNSFSTPALLIVEEFSWWGPLSFQVIDC
jgi:hypothetical protein